MSVSHIPPREKIVPRLYEEDASKYAGPHKLQTTWLARHVRRAFKHTAYTQWASAFTDVEITGAQHLDALAGPAIFVANHSSHLDTVLTQSALPASIADRLFYGAAQDRFGRACSLA